MSDQTQSNNQQMIVIALIVVAVLLAALVGVLVYQQSQAAKIAQLGVPAAQETPPAQTAPGGAPAPAAAGDGTFDAKTATKVPAGTTPAAFVEAYHKAVVDGKFEVAFKMLPTASQQTYGDAAAYGSQIKQYGITGFKLGKPVTSGDTASIAALQENPAMPITYTWNFKKVGGTWYVESRVMGGSVQ